MNGLTKIFAAAVIIGLGVFAWTSLAKAGIIEDVIKPSVQIENFCSGTIVHSDRDKDSGEVETLVLTARHCVQGKSNTSVRVHVYDKSLKKTKVEEFPAKILGSSYKSDLSLLRLSDKSTVFKDVAKILQKDEEIFFGEDAFIAAYPKGGSQTLTQGVLGVIDLNEVFGGMVTSSSDEFLRATPDVAPGSSGSGLFVKRGEDYYLVGVTSGTYTGGTFMNLFVPPSEVREYWDVAKKVLKTQGQ